MVYNCYIPSKYIDDKECAFYFELWRDDVPWFLLIVSYFGVYLGYFRQDQSEVEAAKEAV